MKATKAQQKLLDRAARFQYQDEGFSGSLNGRSINRLQQIAEKYYGGLEAATRLHGSADFRVAYKLQAAGAGKISSCPIVDGYWFVVFAPAKEKNSDY